MSEKLKPCPFCGGEAMSFISPCDSPEGFCSCVECESCKARGPYTTTATSVTNNSHDISPALKAWNTRGEDKLQETRWA